MNNPFINPNPIENLSKLYGRDDYLEYLANQLCEPQRSSWRFAGLPRIGKSSLLRCLPDYIEQLNIPWGSKPLLVYVNLQGLISERVEDLLIFLLTNIIQQAEKKGAKLTKPDAEIVAGRASTLEIKNFFETTLSELRVPLVLLLDEFEVILENLPISALRYLRYLADQLDYVVATRKPLERIYPHHRDSPFFNLLSSLETLQDLSEDNARSFIIDGFETAGVEVTQENVDFVIESVGCAPDYLRVGARELFKSIVSGDEIRWSDYRSRVIKGLESTSSEIWAFMTEEQREVALLLASSPISPPDLALDLLEEFGIVKRNEAGQPSFFSKVFAYFVAAGVGLARPFSEILEVNKTARLVTIRNKEIHLSEREFALFYHLYRHLGETCERSQLIKAVWSEEDVGDEALDVLVSRLRQNLSDGLSITTVRGIGYKLETDGNVRPTTDEDFNFYPVSI